MEKPINRIGLTTVYKPNDLTAHEVDIVIVHGLFGHPENTWTAKVPLDAWSASQDQHETLNETIGTLNDSLSKRIRREKRELFRHVFWPRDLLPKAIPQARVSVWGYDVQIEQMINSSSQASIFQHAATLLADLTAMRTSESDKTKPLIFIAHSLGGIIVKDALGQSRTEQTIYQEILPSTKGVLFLGTPHHGSRTASLGKIACNISELFLQKPNKKILRAIEVNSELLERISRSFGQILDSSHLQVHSFREELNTHGVMVVDSFSSVINHPRETLGMLHANHRDMAKFSSLDDIKFKRLVSVVNGWSPVDISGHMREVSLSAKPADLCKPGDLQDQYTACLQSLDVPLARMRLETVEPAYAHTYEWLFDPSLKFTNWLLGKEADPRFWIQGKPGSGKSTIMKFAISHPMTRQYLNSLDKNPWIIAGYFFHDRGSQAIQKSALGFLREVLYQILCQRPHLFSVIRTLVPQRSGDLSERSSGDIKTHDLATSWTVNLLEQALLSIKSHARESVNLFLVVDALDEHEGNHRELLSILNRLACENKNSYFRLRLCLAGRPENIFRDSLHSCPGFAIHEHTIEDIRTYTQTRLESETGSRLLVDKAPDLARLVTTIIEKAKGVFLWVRLVVDELVEGLCEGDTTAELEELLSTIPTELEGLYTRALCRNRRTSRTRRRIPSDGRFESYIIFQIVISCITVLQLPPLLAAGLFLSTKKGYRACKAEIQGLSMDQMHRRLYSQSAGLLEIHQSNRVQFMHQTVKDYMKTDEGEAVISQGIDPELRQSGNLLLLRYILGPLVDNGLSFDDALHHIDDHDLIKKYLSADNFWDPVFESSPLSKEKGTSTLGLPSEYFSCIRRLDYYLFVTENHEGTCVRPYLEFSILKASKVARRVFFGQALHLIKGNFSTYPTQTFAEDYLDYKPQVLGRGDQPEVQLVLFSALADLPLTFRESLAAYKDKLRDEDIRLLYEIAGTKRTPNLYAIPPTEDWRVYLSELPLQNRIRSIGRINRPAKRQYQQYQTTVNNRSMAILDRKRGPKVGNAK